MQKVRFVAFILFIQNYRLSKDISIYISFVILKHLPCLKDDLLCVLILLLLVLFTLCNIASALKM